MNKESTGGSTCSSKIDARDGDSGRVPQIHLIDEKSQDDLMSVPAPLLSRFLGRLLAKAIYDRQLVDVPLSTYF